MASKLTKISHVVKVGSANYQISTPDLYGNIGDIVGISKKADGDKITLKLTVNELRINGALIRISVRTANKTHSIVCATSKLATALGDLIGKNIPETTTAGGTTKDTPIVSVSIPRKRSRV